MLQRINRYLQPSSKIKISPSEAIIAVTLNCNSRCLMCDIWKKPSKNEVKPDFYQKLPTSLKEINITGGEPFFRDDLPEIIGVIKKRCPGVRLIISTNGFLTKKIKKMMSVIIKIDPKVGVRVSIDGREKTHNKLRGIKGSYKKAMTTLQSLKKIIKDLGIGFTLMEENKDDLLAVFNYCKREHLDFSLSLVSSSSIYFGNEKESLKPQKGTKIKKTFAELIESQYKTFEIKNWFRAWFNQGLYEFLTTKKRRLLCEGGKDFFYLDPYGGVYICHLKPWLIGNLKKESFEGIINSEKADRLRKMANKCHDCWMVCNVRNKIKKNFANICWQVFPRKLGFRKNV